MSRPPISYPIAGPSNYATSTSRQPLEPSPMPSSDATVRRSSGRRNSQRSTEVRAVAATLDSHITMLLVHTKQLLQGLHSWSGGKMTEEGVSDIYVKLGNEFDNCKQVFRAVGISTTDLQSIPKDLRHQLEDCLAETPSSEGLSQYLPSIRHIIFNLLNGLKHKQATFKRMQEDREQAGAHMPSLAEESAVQPERQPPPPSVYSNHSDRSSDSHSPAKPEIHLPPARVPSSQALAERARTAMHRPAPPDAFRPPRRNPDAPRRSPSPQPAQLNASTSSVHSESDGLVRHQLSDNPVPSPHSQSVELPRAPPPPPKPIPHPDRFSRDSLGRPVSRFSMDSEVTNASPIRSMPSQSPARSARASSSDADATPMFMAPPSLPTLNLPTTTFGFGEDEPVSVADAMPDVPPETRATLAALGRSEALERRASKRFSSYTFNKLPGSPNHKKAQSSDSPQRPTRRADRPPPMPRLPESWASSNLVVSAADRSKTPTPGSGLAPPTGDDYDSRSSPKSNRTDESDSSSTGSVRVVRTPERIDVSNHNTPRPGASSPPLTPSPAGIYIFLQIGRQVKRTKVELPVSLSSLRLLFMEKFEYDPGVENFPDVYIRDHVTGVQFELEDTGDLKEGSLLNLDVEPLEQIQRHVGQGFASMLDEMRDMKKELKAALDQSRRLSMAPPPSLLAPSPSMTRPVAATPTGSPSSVRAPRELGPAPIDTGAGSTPIKMGLVSAEKLRAHQDEVESLRRDLAVMRQIHVDFLGETKEAFTRLREENNNMRDLVKTKMGGSRAILDNSKLKLEALSADVIAAVEEISDVIDSAREDAFKRFVTPSKSQMTKITADLKKAHDMIDTFRNEVAAVEPTWRSTWHAELSRVMEEQKSLPFHKDLAKDLKNDIEDAEGIFKNVSDFVEQRAANSGRMALRPVYRPPSPDETGGVQNLLMEIRTKETDPDQRLRAIEARQKAREKEKASQVDEFQDELSGFVQGRKLKKTGGTDEVERQRQRKQEQTLKRMLTGESGGGSPTGLLSPQPTGASVRSQSSFTSATAQGGGADRSGAVHARTASRASTRSEEVLVKQEPEDDVQVKIERE